MTGSGNAVFTQPGDAAVHPASEEQDEDGQDHRCGGSRASRTRLREGATASVVPIRGCPKGGRWETSVMLGACRTGFRVCEPEAVWLQSGASPRAYREYGAGEQQRRNALQRPRHILRLL